MVGRYLIAGAGAFCGIHDEPDVGFHTSDFDVGIISGEDAAGPIIVLVYERLNTDGGRFTIVGDLLV